MLDVPELEKRWAKYHLKKMLPLYITTAVGTVILGLAAYIYTTQPDYVMSLLQKEPTETITPTLVKTSTLQAATDLPVPAIPAQNILRPSLTFLYNLEERVINAEESTTPVATAVATKDKLKQQVKPKSKPKTKSKKKVKTKKKVKPKPKAKPKPVKTKTIPKPTKKVTKTSVVVPVKVIHPEKKEQQPVETQNTLVKVGHDTTSDDELKGIIKRFNRKKKPALSLFIANKYYEKGNYAESYKYARITYKLNPKIEDSMIIYAKSLVKLGKKDKAKNALSTYIKKTGSIKAKTLLNQINKGTFK